MNVSVIEVFLRFYLACQLIAVHRECNNNTGRFERRQGQGRRQNRNRNKPDNNNNNNYD